MSADVSAIALKLLELKAKLRSYYSDDLWNADEFGFFLSNAWVDFVAKSLHTIRAQKRQNAYYFFCCLQHQREMEDAAYGYWKVTQPTLI